MIIECPSCHARFAVPDHAIGAAGRTVKCAKCANQWFVAGIANAEEKLEALLKQPEKPAASAPIPKGSNLPKAAARSTPLLNAMLIASGFLAVISSFAVGKPDWFGLGNNSSVTLSDIALEKQEVERGVEFAVSGKMVNPLSEAVEPPTVRITLVDKDGSPLQYWEPMLPRKIEPKTSLPFTFGPLKTKFASNADRLVVEVGSSLQLAMRSKP